MYWHTVAPKANLRGVFGSTPYLPHICYWYFYPYCCLRILPDWLSIGRGHIWHLMLHAWYKDQSVIECGCCCPVLPSVGNQTHYTITVQQSDSLTVWHTFTVHHYNNSWRLPALSTLRFESVYTDIKEALQKLSLAFLGLIHHQISCPFFTHFCLNLC